MGDVKNLIIENEGLQEKVDFQRELLMETGKANQDLQMEVEELKRSQKRLQNHIAGLKNDNLSLTIERNKVMDENTKLKARNLSLIKRCQKLQDKLDNVTMWDLSAEAQEEAGHALARDLLGR